MHGIFVHQDRRSQSSGVGDNEHLCLLARRPGIEVMRQMLLKNATVWIAPAEDLDTFEFFYVLSGSLRLVLDDETLHIVAGDSFYVDGLLKKVYIETECDTELLYLTNKSIYDKVNNYQENLDELMRKVDAKDHYTYRHSRNVMEYSLTLARRLLCDQQDIDNLVTASLFHDVGKCFVPDEILNKPGKLTPQEYEQMMKHPLDSGRLLEPRFGKHVAAIARSHHERLDGSGYPLGLIGDEISPEGRIIAVIDSFDTMTSRRVYSRNPKSFLQAAEELCSLPALYDEKVCTLLLEMVKTGEIVQKESVTIE